MQAPLERPPLSFVPAERLLAHEQTVEPRVQELVKLLQRERVIRLAIVADAATLTVLDGHHRLEALRRLGCKRIPVLLVRQVPTRMSGLW